MENSAPDHDAGIDSLTAFVTYRDGQRDLTLFTERTDIGVEEQLDFSTHSRPAPRAGRVIELEVPQPITLGTAVVREDLDLAIDNVFLGSGVAIRLVRRLTLGGRKTHGQQRESMRSLRIEDIDAHAQVHGIARTDSLAETSQEETDSRELIGVQKSIER